MLQQLPGTFVAVGASMGGYTAAAIARLAPERLAGLVLVGSRADADPPERAPLREEWIRIAREQGGEGLWEAAAKNFFAPGTPDELVEQAHRIAAEQDPEGLVRAITAIRDRPDSTEAVTSGIPLLVVAGEQDPLIPVVGGRGARRALAGRPRGGARLRPPARTGSGRTSSTGCCRPSSRRCERAFRLRVVDAAWVAEHLGEEGLLLADVRGPNAHIRGHLPGSIPLVLGSPAPVTDRAVLEETAAEVGLRLRRHGVTGEERLVLYDGGDCIGACSSAQLAELAGHPAVSIMAGGLKSWTGDLEVGVVELDKNRNELDPRFEAVPTVEELAGRLDDPELTILDVRRPDEYTGKCGYPCDPRQGHIPGARLLEAGELFASPGMPLGPEEIRALVGLPEGAEIVAYCHSGSRSALAAMALRSAGYRARNYPGSWHEWSRHDELADGAVGRPSL